MALPLGGPSPIISVVPVSFKPRQEAGSSQRFNRSPHFCRASCPALSLKHPIYLSLLYLSVAYLLDSHFAIMTMSFENEVPHQPEVQQQYTFRDEGWPVGDQPRFEVELANSEGNEPADEEKCVRVIKELPSRTDKMSAIRTNSVQLYRRILRQDISRLLPRSRTGSTAASLRFVIKYVYGTIDPPSNSQHPGLPFLKWLTQICITLWIYQCGRSAIEQLQGYVSGLILDYDYRPVEDAAAYLAITAFVLGGALERDLVEYVDAVVWYSKADLESALGPLGRSMNRRSITPHLVATS